MQNSGKTLFVIGAGLSVCVGMCPMHGDPRILSVHYLSIHDVGGDFRTLEGLATLLLRRIRQHQSHGPYDILGAPFCGMLAYEVASQLVGRDEQVRFLGLIETRCLSFGERQKTAASVPPDLEADCLVGLLRSDYVHPTAEIEKCIGPDSSILSFDTLLERARQCLLVPAETSIDHAQRAIQRIQALQRAELAYEPSPSSLCLQLLSADEERLQLAAQSWHSLVTPARIKCQFLGGDQSLVEQGIGCYDGAVSSDVNGAATAASSGLPESKFSSLVTIQRGGRGQTPLFCVPGAGASATDFLSLTTILDAGRPVYAFQPRGLDNDLLPHVTVEAAAQCYLRELRRVSASGAVHLVGHSFGGWVAFEMALRLGANGRKISLTLIDCEQPATDGKLGREYTRFEALEVLVSLFEQAATKPLNVRWEHLRQLEPVGQVDYLHSCLVQCGLMPRNSCASALYGTIRTFGAALRTGYFPSGTLTVPVTLVLVPLVDEDADSAHKRFESTARGWMQFAPNIQLRRGNGNHITILRLPHVASVGDWMQQRWAPQLGSRSLDVSSVKENP